MSQKEWARRGQQSGSEKRKNRLPALNKALDAEVGRGRGWGCWDLREEDGDI